MLGILFFVFCADPNVVVDCGKCLFYRAAPPPVAARADSLNDATTYINALNTPLAAAVRDLGGIYQITASAQAGDHAVLQIAGSKVCVANTKLEKVTAAMVQSLFAMFGQAKAAYDRLPKANAVGAPVAPPAAMLAKGPAAPPAAEPAKGPAAPPAADPAKGPAAPPAAEPAKGPAAPPAAEPAKGPAAPPAAEPAKGPAAPPAAEPAKGPVAPPPADNAAKGPVAPPQQGPQVERQEAQHKAAADRTEAHRVLAHTAIDKGNGSKANKKLTVDEYDASIAAGKTSAQAWADAKKLWGGFLSANGKSYDKLKDPVFK